MRPEEAVRLCKEEGLHYFTTTSAKSGENVQGLFVDIAKFLYNKYRDILSNDVDTIGKSDVSGSMITSVRKGSIIQTD